MDSVRVSRKDFITPRCTKACPAGVDVPRYIRAVKDGRYDDAIAVLREKLPLPIVCADACFAPCEDVCSYKQFGDPIAIRALKRAAVDNGSDTWKQQQITARDSGKKVAVIGAGPTGLTAAYYLALKGHAVNLYDIFPRPGGMLRYGIPSYRLPRERLDRDIQTVLDLGVTFKGNVTIGKDLPLSQIHADHDALLIATGANSSVHIPLEGKDKDNVIWGWNFLRDVALNNSPRIGNRVAVIGGGNVAVDVALTARRLGARDVSVICLESREEMPAHPWEIKLAEEEGVRLLCEWAPNKIFGDECACGVSLKRCVSVFDDCCEFNPAYDDMITNKIDADTIILAIGQSPVLDFVEYHTGITVTGNRINTDDTLATGEPGIFSGGDVVTGPLSIISGIAQGRKAAAAMDEYLGGSGDITEHLAPKEEAILLPPMERVVRQRNQMPHLAPWERQGFEQVEQSLTLDQIKAEAARCLNCDARQFDVILDTEKCKECGYCADCCTVETFTPADFFNTKGYRPMEVKNSDNCVGCLKCFFVCPDFAINIHERTA
jgi:NADPH-dependent glutamate synthase beta subunit-like oxidoreductase/NAD-dependent dihydropyrimidine dehydrogenase PreA subunit